MELGLRHGLPSRHTSFVGVDSAAPEGSRFGYAGMVTREVANQVPHGMFGATAMAGGAVSFLSFFQIRLACMVFITPLGFPCVFGLCGVVFLVFAFRFFPFRVIVRFWFHYVQGFFSSSVRLFLAKSQNSTICKVMSRELRYVVDKRLKVLVPGAATVVPRERSLYARAGLPSTEQ